MTQGAHSRKATRLPTSIAYLRTFEYTVINEPGASALQGGDLSCPGASHSDRDCRSPTQRRNVRRSAHRRARSGTGQRLPALRRIAKQADRYQPQGEQPGLLFAARSRADRSARHSEALFLRAPLADYVHDERDSDGEGDFTEVNGLLRKV